MANILKRFNQSAKGSGEQDIDYIAKITSKGDFERITDINTILNSWNNILLTPKGTYPYDPQYGSDLYKMVFEPLDEATSNRIQQETIVVLQEYDNRAEIESVNVTFFRNQKGFNLDLVVRYEGNIENLSVTLTEKAFAGFLTSEAY